MSGPRGAGSNLSAAVPLPRKYAKKFQNFFYKLRTKNCSKSRTKIGMSVDTAVITGHVRRGSKMSLIW